MLEQIQFTYQIPFYWIIGGAISVAALAVQFWASVKVITTKVEKQQEEINELKEIKADVAYIRGKISHLK